MTVQSTTSRVSYVGAGVITPLPIPFRFLADGDIRAIMQVSNLAVPPVTWVLGVDYTLTGARAVSGGTLTPLAAIPVGATVVIDRGNMQETQLIDYKANDPFPEESAEDGLDKLTMLYQQSQTDIGRSPTLYPTDVDGAGRYNANNNRIVNLADGIGATDAVTLQQVTSLIGPGSGTFLQSGAGAQARSYQDKLRDYVSVFDFMTASEIADVKSGLLTQNVTAACQAAMNASKCVYFPPGSYLVTSLNLQFQQTIYGAGLGTILVAADDTSSVINAAIFDGNIKDFQITNRNGALYPAAGAFRAATGKGINIAGPRITVERVLISLQGIGIQIDGSIVTLRDCELRNQKPTSGICINILGGADITLDNIVTDNDPSIQPQSGITIHNAADVTITSANIIRSGFDLLMNPGTGEAVYSVLVANSFFDTSFAPGIALTPTGTGSIDRCLFVNVNAQSHTTTGVFLDTSGGGFINGINFTDIQASLNGADGIALLGANTKGVHIKGGFCAQNGGSGISTGSGCTDWRVTDFSSGAGYGLSGNAFGIFIGTTNTNFSVTNSEFVGNTTANVGNGSPGESTAIITGNVNFPIPAIAPTLSGSWVNFGGAYEGASYRKDAAGFVHLAGLVKSGAIPSAIFTLPAGFRPSGTQAFSVVSFGAFGVVEVDSSGVVTASVGNTGSVSLSGISFKTA